MLFRIRIIIDTNHTFLTQSDNAESDNLKSDNPEGGNENNDDDP